MIGNAGKYFNWWEAPENISTCGKCGKIWQLVGSAGKYYNWWEARENLQLIGNAGKCFNWWEVRENIITAGKPGKILQLVKSEKRNFPIDGKCGKILQLMRSMVKYYSWWDAREKIATYGKRGKILELVESEGKSYNRWVARENFMTGGKCRKLFQLVEKRGKWHNLETNTSVLVTVILFVGVFFGVILAQFVVLYWVFSLSQVREMAAVTFSGLVHYGFFQLDDELQVQDYGCHFLNCFSSTWKFCSIAFTCMVAH